MNPIPSGQRVLLPDSRAEEVEGLNDVTERGWRGVVFFGITKPRAKTSKIPSLGLGGKLALSPKLKAKNKKGADLANKGSSNILVRGPIIPVLTV